MGFESKISGYIASDLIEEEHIAAIQEQIDKLPTLENDVFPFLPKDIFGISKPISNTANKSQITYRSTMIHFAMSVKQLEDDLEIWLKKFEVFFKAIPGAYEANATISLSPYTGGYKNNNLNYNWRKTSLMTDNDDWTFNGDPTNLDEIVNPFNQTDLKLTTEIINNIIEQLQWLGSQIGKRITIEDKITSKVKNYDRHFTRNNNYEFELKHFTVRTSGAIGMIHGECITIEFKIDNIQSIEQEKNTLIMEMSIDSNTTQIIRIEVKKE